MKDIFQKDLSGEIVSPNEPGYDALIADIFDTMRTATEMTPAIKPRRKCMNIWARFSVNPLTRPPQCFHLSILTTEGPLPSVRVASYSNAAHSSVAVV